MTEDQIEEYNTSLKLFAGIALPGVIIALGVLPNPATVAGTCFEIAEAMMKESKKRELKSEEDGSNSSNNS